MYGAWERQAPPGSGRQGFAEPEFYSKHEPLERLHFITFDDEAISHAQLADEACRGGVRLVQLRTKGKEYAEWLQIAREVKTVCDKYRAQLIINDNVFVAKALGAYGVHLGREDLSVSEARQVLGAGFVIGGTAHNRAEVLALIEAGVDYIGVGPFRETSTKKVLSPVLGLSGISELLKAAQALEGRVTQSQIGISGGPTSQSAKRGQAGFGRELSRTELAPPVPIIAIGGIEESDVLLLIETGVYGVAVSAAIGRAASIHDSAARFVKSLEESIL